MMRRFFIVVFSIGLQAVLTAQVDTTDGDTTGFYVAHGKIGSNRPFYRVQLEGAIGLQSRNFSSNNLLLLASGSFLDNADKQTLLDEINTTVSLGFEQRWEIGVHQQKRNKGEPGEDAWGISLYQQGYNVLSAPKSTLELALFGNKRFAGTTVSLDDTKYQSWLYTGIRYHFATTVLKQPVQMGVSAILGNEYVNYDVTRLSLFTEQEGSYLELDGKYALSEYSTGADYGVAGIGAAYDFSTQIERGNSTWNFGLNDFGFVYWTSGESVAQDTTIRFSGFDVQNIFQIKDSLLRQQREDLESRLWFNDGSNRAALMPFSAYAAYGYTFAKEGFTGINTSLQYRHLPAFLPQLTVGVPYRFNENHVVQASAAVGGFNAFTIGLKYVGVFGRYKLTAEVQNVPGVVAPSFGMGTVVQGGLYYNMW